MSESTIESVRRPVEDAEEALYRMRRPHRALRAVARLLEPELAHDKGRKLEMGREDLWCLLECISDQLGDALDQGASALSNAINAPRNPTDAAGRGRRAA